MADQDLELRRRGGRVVSLALPAFLPSAISFIPEIRGLGSGPPGPSPRSATDIESFTVLYCGRINNVAIILASFCGFFCINFVQNSLF